MLEHEYLAIKPLLNKLVIPAAPMDRPGFVASFSVRYFSYSLLMMLSSLN